MDIVAEFHYDAAHLLPNVPGGHKCGRLHGHTYYLAVIVNGAVDSRSGWVVDFAEIKAIVEPVIALLDHRYLNDVIENPTVEHQLVWLWNQLPLDGLYELRLREGVGNSAIYAGTS